MSNQVTPQDQDAVVYRAELSEHGLVEVRVEQLPPDATREGGAVPDDAPRAEVPRDKVHPELRRLLRVRPPEERHELIVVFTEQPRIPRFPEPLDEPRDSPGNVALQAEADDLVRAIQERQEPRYREWEATLDALHQGIRVLGRYWLISGVLIEAPLAAVARLAAADIVVSVEPRYPNERPPQATVFDGRARVGTDPVIGLGLTGTSIGLLDTGVRATHDLLSNPSVLGRRLDCVNGGADCNTGAALDPSDQSNHGTATAAILAGNMALGDPFRGVTRSTVDSLKVYRKGTLDADAAVRGFHVLTKSIHGEVVVAEMQGEHDHLSALAQAADQAFDGGAVVVAANGNLTLTGGNAVKCPANAHRVIGVGAYGAATGLPSRRSASDRPRTTAPSPISRARPTRRQPAARPTSG